MKTTNNPVAANYVPAYDEPARELERLERCVQQQVEDLFTTISRIQRLAEATPPGLTALRWKTLREGLRCWRAAVSAIN